MGLLLFVIIVAFVGCVALMMAAQHAMAEPDEPDDAELLSVEPEYQALRTAQRLSEASWHARQRLRGLYDQRLDDPFGPNEKGGA